MTFETYENNNDVLLERDAYSPAREELLDRDEVLGGDQHEMIKRAQVNTRVEETQPLSWIRSLPRTLR